MIKRKKDASGLPNAELCPRCHASRLIGWGELSDEQRSLAERLPASAEFTPEERKKHRFCTRCWFEETEHKITTA